MLRYVGQLYSRQGMEKTHKTTRPSGKKDIFGKDTPSNQSFVYFCRKSGMASASDVPGLYKTSNPEKTDLLRGGLSRGQKGSFSQDAVLSVKLL